MVDKIRLVQGDTRPALAVTLTDTTTGLPIDITGATVRLKFKEAGASTLTATITGSITSGPDGTVVFHWSSEPTSLNGDPGDYEGEVEITFSDSTIQTVYEVLKFKLRQDF